MYQLWPCHKSYFQLSMISPILLLLIVVSSVLASPEFTLAQGGYPEPTDQFIDDYAGLLTSTDRANVHELLADMRQETGIEAVVVTIDSIDDYDTADKTIESFATHLFNTWGIGDQTKNDGVLILVAVNDRKVRIEVGSGYGSSQDAAMQDVINEHILPSFRQEKYSQGIYRGTRAVVGELTGHWPEDASVATPGPTRPAPAPQPSRTNQTSSGFIWSTILGLVALVSGGTVGLKKYRRYRPRTCPNCQTKMTRLDEQSDDIYLDSGQKLEEILQAVDYDVWQCPGCNYHTLFHYPSLFTRLKTCPSCHYRTLKTYSVTLSQPTYTSKGREKITKDCQHCDYHNEHTVALPMLKRTEHNSSSSRSSSWKHGSSRSKSGGGRSSGGGASGRW